MESTSETLLYKLRCTTDQEAWGRFVELYTPLLHRWAKLCGLTDADADDLVQDVLLVALSQLPTFQYTPDGSFRGWLSAIARNKALELFRKRKVIGRGTGDEGLELVAIPSQAEAFMEQQYKAALVNKGFQLVRERVTATTWKAAEELLLHDRSAAEVAEQLGLSVGAVYIAKSRVLAMLKELLTGFVDAEN